MTTLCPACGVEATRVIYAGLPGYTCPDETCGCFWGLAARAASMSSRGHMLEYDQGGLRYPLAYLMWLFTISGRERLVWAIIYALVVLLGVVFFEVVL